MGNNFSREPLDYAPGGSINSPGLAVMTIVALVCLAAGYFLGHHAPPSSLAPSAAISREDISVHFSPKGGCTDAAVTEIDDAHQSIEMQAYSFTSKEIASALISAAHRGVKVTIIADEKDLDARSKAGQCARAGCTVLADGVHAFAHNKIILIDGRSIITGSFNFTEQAESRNAENLVIIHNHPDLYGAYERNFQTHARHSKPYSDAMMKESKRGRIE
jgi:phosphatidylserine/phosphatidylglycerophosphate/cardiolipin synthase-like enzyme